MNYPIDTAAAEPAYLQLYLHLRRDITAGVYPLGKRLPSRRTIAEETGVSLITVSHAIDLLCDEGYVEARERSGVFVIYRRSDFPGERAAPPVFSPRGVPVHSGDGFPFSVLARTIRRTLQDYGERILERSPNHGCAELREEICAYLARSRGLRVKPEQVIIGSGAEHLYGLIAQLLGERSFAVEDPCYEKILRVYALFGIRCDRLPLQAEGIGSAELWGTQATVLHVTPFHSYPSGITASASKKSEYLRWAAERGGIIIEDNYDSELTISTKAEDALFSLTGGHQVIYVNTFSKTIAPSMRIGYMLLPEELTVPFNEKLGFEACTVPVLEQYVLAGLLRSGDYERHLNRERRKRRRAAEG